MYSSLENVSFVKIFKRTPSQSLEHSKTAKRLKKKNWKKYCEE